MFKSIPFVSFAAARLRERSTWLGIIAVMSATGVTLAPAAVTSIVTVGTAVAGAVAVLFPESGTVAK